mmetsp:Transcript_74716/g.211100  ORF Transcript_74716/g.211100 Transcript_74716/m.211100 type:complete len:486 (-) Transcript_74716:523-1980(-)
MPRHPGRAGPLLGRALLRVRRQNARSVRISSAARCSLLVGRASNLGVRAVPAGAGAAGLAGGGAVQLLHGVRRRSARVQGAEGRPRGVRVMPRQLPPRLCEGAQQGRRRPGGLDLPHVLEPPGPGPPEAVVAGAGAAAGRPPGPRGQRCPLRRGSAPRLAVADVGDHPRCDAEEARHADLGGRQARRPAAPAAGEGAGAARAPGRQLPVRLPGAVVDAGAQETSPRAGRRAGGARCRRPRAGSRVSSGGAARLGHGRPRCRQARGPARRGGRGTAAAPLDGGGRGTAAEVAARRPAERAALLAAGRRVRRQASRRVPGARARQRARQQAPLRRSNQARGRGWGKKGGAAHRARPRPEEGRAPPRAADSHVPQREVLRRRSGLPARVATEAAAVRGADEHASEEPAAAGRRPAGARAAVRAAAAPGRRPGLPGVRPVPRLAPHGMHAHIGEEGQGRHPGAVPGDVPAGRAEAGRRGRQRPGRRRGR